jgi:hypothetical protein
VEEVGIIVDSHNVKEGWGWCGGGEERERERERRRRLDSFLFGGVGYSMRERER